MFFLPVEDSVWEDRFRGFDSLLPIEHHKESVLPLESSRDFGRSRQSSSTALSTRSNNGLALSSGGQLATSLPVNHGNPIITDQDGNRKFFLEFDVRQFRPDEISVRTENGVLSIHAAQGCEETAGSSARQAYSEFARQYALPGDLNEDALLSELSPDGVLTVTAPLPPVKKALEGGFSSRRVAIEHFGH